METKCPRQESEMSNSQQEDKYLNEAGLPRINQLAFMDMIAKGQQERHRLATLADGGAAQARKASK
jgi:hypothetical protein